MAITIFKKVVNINKIRIINKNNKPKEKVIKVKGDVKLTKHSISEVKKYD